jgi:uncharacterized membrane protein HdeD (DUF308 family)
MQSAFPQWNEKAFGMEEVQRHWMWYFALGAFMTLLGVVAIGWSFTITLLSMVFFGWLLILGGVVEAVHAFWKRKWSGFFLDLLAGILYGGMGFILVSHPILTAEALTFMIAILLMFGGLFRVLSAFALNPPHGNWVTLNGAVSLLLGVLIWQGWPTTGLWVIGLFIGIDLILNGVSVTMLAVTGKKLTYSGAA